MLTILIVGYFTGLIATMGRLYWRDTHNTNR